MSLCDLPYDLFPLIALRMATSVPEIDDLARRTQICLCGSKETTYLSSLLAKQLTMRSQVETKTNHARIAMKPDDLIYHHYVNRLVLKLRKIEYQFASVSSKQRRKRGRHLPNSKCNTIAVRIEVAIHSTEERFSCLR
jgi:hypothetical protein